MPPSALESTAAATPRRAAIGDSGADTRAKVTRAAPSRNYMAGNESDLPDGYIAPTADSSTACAQTRALPIFRDTNAAAGDRRTGRPREEHMTNSAPRKGDIYLKFTGADSYVEIASIGDYSVATTGELSVAAWIRPDTLNFSRWEGTR